MIAIEVIRLRLATMAARLTAACPGAPRSCESASRGAASRGSGISVRITAAILGISISAPTRSSPIAT